MRTVLGLDINGLRDLVVEGDGEGVFVTKDLGIHGSVIQMASDRTKWVGGLQAALAPHGRGGGWGAIGNTENRVFWADVMEALASDRLNERQAEAVTTFLDSLVDDHTDVHVAVPDAPCFDEPARDRLIRLLSQTRRIRATLLWRPVAAALGWLDDLAGHPEIVPEPEMRIGVLSLMGGGIQYANLKLIKERWAGSELWVPERSTAGSEFLHDCGGAALAKLNVEAIAPRIPSVDPSLLTVSNSPWRLAVGERPGFELVRTPNRSWQRVENDVSPKIEMSRADVPEHIRSRLSQADALIIEGPAAGNTRWLKAVLDAAGTPLCPIHVGHKELVAEGCLVAALRSRSGAPTYYDFLPQLEINAFVGNEPRFVELIPKSQRLHGGTIYRGKAPGNFTIARGADRPIFYLFKEDFSKGRKAQIKLPEEADRDHAIFVTVEQSPGQGFARVRVTSDSFKTLQDDPIELDWSTMELVEGSKEEILESLSCHTGLAYPDAVATPGHPFLWHPSHPKGNCFEQVRDYLTRPLIQRGVIDIDARDLLQTLRNRFSSVETPSYLARRMGLSCEDQGSFRALNSDGEIPEKRGIFAAPQGAREALQAALQKVGKELEQVLSDEKHWRDDKLIGDIVGFSTWCFWRCPSTVVDLLLDVYSGQSSVSINHNLCREGLGRVLNSLEDVARYFNAVDRNIQSRGHLFSAEFAALAKVLGTCSQAAEVLQPPTADMILRDTCRQLAEENRQPQEKAYKRKFKASLLMLAALLRHRRRRPDFLDPGCGRTGRPLLDQLEGALSGNNRFKDKVERLRDRTQNARTAASHNAAARRFGLNSEIIQELIAMVNGAGSDPNIIRKISEMEE